MFKLWKKPRNEDEDKLDLRVFPPAQDLYQELVEKHVDAIEVWIAGYLDIDSPPTLNSDMDIFAAQDTSCCCRIKRTSHDITKFYEIVIAELMEKPKIKDYVTKHQIKFKIHMGSRLNEAGNLTASLRFVSARARCGCALL